MSKERTKSRPVSFRVPLERWGALAARAEAVGLSPGKLAERMVLEALHGMGESPQEAVPYTGGVEWGGRTWGAEASMPDESREDDLQAIRRARLDALQDVDQGPLHRQEYPDPSV